MTILAAFQPHGIQRLRQLNPDTDYIEMSHLLFEVVYGHPMMVHLLHNYSFCMNMAIPDIMKVVYRKGTGPIVTDTRKRSDDTISFISGFLDYRNPQRRKAMIEKVNQIHSHFSIPNEHMLFTTATFVCDPERIVGNILPGTRLFAPDEQKAVFNFWKDTAEQMGTTDIPASYEALRDWYFDYIETHATPTEGCRAITHAMANEWAERWFPGPAKATGTALFMAALDDKLRHCADIPKPHPIYKSMLQTAIRAILFSSRHLWNAPMKTTVGEVFEKDLYRDKGFDFLERGGYQPEKSVQNGKCPITGAN
jgi:hypothetical protein